MQLNKFIQALTGIHTEWILTTHPEEEIYSFKPYPMADDFMENMLYIGELKELPLTEKKLKYNFLCIVPEQEKIDLSYYKEHYSNSNFVITRSGLGFRSVCDHASEIFYSETKYTSWINHMVAASNENRGLSYLVDEAFSITHCPIIIIDTSYKILAMYKDKTIESRPDLEDQRDLGYLTTQNIKRMKQDRIYEKARDAHFPYYSKASDEDYSWLNTLVYIHGIEVAEIGMLELGRRFNHYDFEFLNFFSQLVSWEMQKSDFYKNNRGIMHSVFLSDLLDYKIPTEKIVALRKEQLNWIDAPYLFVFTIFDSEIHTFNQRAQIIAYQVHHIFPAARYVIYESKLVFLVQQMEEDLTIFAEDGPLAEFLASNHLTGMVSNCFGDLMQIRKFYNQTLKVNELRPLLHEDRLIYHYSDYMFLHVGQIIAESYTLKDFYHPAILKMQAYDKENQTNFIETLHEYLLHVDNPTLSARNLFIHKNTFFYRMNKIRELFRVDLGDGMERLKLHLSLEFIKLEQQK